MPASLLCSTTKTLLVMQIVKKSIICVQGKDNNVKMQRKERYALPFIFSLSWEKAEKQMILLNRKEPQGIQECQFYGISFSMRKKDSLIRLMNSLRRCGIRKIKIFRKPFFSLLELLIKICAKNSMRHCKLLMKASFIIRLSSLLCLKN